MAVGVPEYRRIREALRAELEQGDLKPGDRVPTERELVERFGVAHMTVRHAIDGLVREGLLVRRRGSGTFVAKSSSLTRSVNRLQSFTDDMSGKTVGARVVFQGEVEPDPEVAEHLELAGGKGKVVELLRVRTVDGEPAAINQVWVPVRVAPQLANADMTDASLYGYLAGTAGVQLARAEQWIFAVPAEARQADLLGIEVGSPLLATERVTRDQRNIPVEFARAWSKPDISVRIEMRP